MEYCLIEKWQADYALPAGSRAVALTPSASYQLDKAGIDYVTFGDYFSSGEIRGDTDSYLYSQIEWIKEFDQFIQNVYPEAKELELNLATLFFYNIKYLVDSIILSARVLNRFIDIAGPSKIWYSPQVYGKDEIIRVGWFVFGESSLFRLVKPICEKSNIAYQELICEGAQERSNQKKVNRIKVLGRLMNLLNTKQEELLAKAKKSIKRRMCLIGFHKGAETKNIFVVREQYYTDGFYKDCFKNGCMLFLKENDNIYKLGFFMQKKIARIMFRKINNNGDAAINVDGIMKSFAGSQLMSWINLKCEVDVSKIIFSRFKFMIGEIFPETIVRIKQYMDFYNQKKIDFVASYSLSTVDDFAAVAACGKNNAAKSVGFSHGMDAYEVKSRFLRDYNLFDYYFVNLKEELEHIENLPNLLKRSQVKINYHSYLTDSLKSIKKARIKKRVWKCKKDKPLVVFLPVERSERMNMPIENNQSLQWDYFTWHKKVLDFFDSRQDFNFICKGMPLRYGRVDTMFHMVNDIGSKNIDFSTESIGKWFKYADRVICDVPSTAFFESILCGLPTLGLYRPKDQMLRKEAYVSYAKCLKPYSNNDEGIEAINSFLNSKQESYLMPITYQKISVMDFIIKNKEHSL